MSRYTPMIDSEARQKKLVHLGSLIKRLIEVNQITQQILADRTGLTKGYISNLCKAVITHNMKRGSIPEDETLEKIADALCVEAFVLHQALGRCTTKKPSQEYRNIDTAYVVSEFDSLSPSGCEIVLAALQVAIKLDRRENPL